MIENPIIDLEDADDFSVKWSAAYAKRTYLGASITNSEESMDTYYVSPTDPDRIASSCKKFSNIVKRIF